MVTRGHPGRGDAEGGAHGNEPPGGGDEQDQPAEQAERGERPEQDSATAEAISQEPVGSSPRRRSGAGACDPL